MGLAGLALAGEPGAPAAARALPHSQSSAQVPQPDPLRAEPQAQAHPPATGPRALDLSLPPVGHAGPRPEPAQAAPAPVQPPPLTQVPPGQTLPAAPPAAEHRPLGSAQDRTRPGPGSQAILEACWGPEQLAGTEPERLIRRGSKSDRESPPAWALQAAASALPPLGAGDWGSIRGVEPSDPQAHLIALGFDLCEQAGERTGYEGAVVDWLRAQGTRATFFAGGQWLRTHPERAMQLMADPLFELGNHGWTHANLRVVKGEAAREQILWTQAEYGVLRERLLERPCAARAGALEAQSIPHWPRVLRFPYGACDRDSLDLAARLGLPAVQWSLVTGDPDPGRGAAAIARGVREGLRGQRGAILVAHANGRGRHTADSLPLFVPQLIAEGWRFVTLSELLAAGRPIVADSCYETRPGDNLRYDRPPSRRAEP
jgi:peptidoglycan/xylan/chitin deacetylase (PgdA/CDA1 family)